MTLIEMAFASDAYERAWLLRQAALRAPLGLTLDMRERTAEAGHRHFALITDANELAACVSVVPLPDHSAKLRQMAVNENMRGAGLGRELITGVETLLARQGICHLHMHARGSAVGFYQKLGYQAEGDPFVEITIPHIRMTKSLPAPDPD
jgi:predicted GNAT family N-acyltransferase